MKVHESKTNNLRRALNALIFVIIFTRPHRVLMIVVDASCYFCRVDPSVKAKQNTQISNGIL